MKWVTNFIKENQDEWRKQREKEEEKARRELEEWNKMKRLEKIKHIKRKWKKETEEKGNIEITTPEQRRIEEKKWSVWREKKKKLGLSCAKLKLSWRLWFKL